MIKFSKPLLFIYCCAMSFGALLYINANRDGDRIAGAIFFAAGMISLTIYHVTLAKNQNKDSEEK